MSGVFLSYSRNDHALGEQVIRGLRRIGVEVWWDQDMPGVDWQEELERELHTMVAVVVLWTANSAASKYVRDEARLGLNTDKLVNLLVGVEAPPFPFDRVNGLVLDGWDGREPHHGWTMLIRTIEALAVQEGGAQPGEIEAALERNEQALRTQQEALSLAQEAFQEAQSLEVEAGETAKTASDAFARAEEDLGRVGEMRLGAVIIGAAHRELEAARTANQEAIAARHASRTGLSEASRALSRAKADLERLYISEPIEPPSRPVAKPPKAKAADRAPVEASPAKAADVSAPPGPPTSHPPEPQAAPPSAPVSPHEPTAAPMAKERLAEPPPKAPSPGAVDRPAPVSMDEPAPRPTQRALGRWLVAAAVVVAVVVIGASQLSRHPAPANVAAPASVAQASVIATVPAAASPAVDDPAVKLVGSWALEGLNCKNPVTFSETNGALLRTFKGATSPVTVDPSGGSGALDFRAADGNTYSLSKSDELSLILAGGVAVEMTRCPG